MVNRHIAHSLEGKPPEQWHSLYVGETLCIRPNKEKINPNYLLYFLRTPFAHAQIKRCITGQSAHLYPEDIAKNVIVLLPPDKGEYFASKIAMADKLIKKSKDVIRKTKKNLTEYFDSLEFIPKKRDT